MFSDGSNQEYLMLITSISSRFTLHHDVGYMVRLQLVSISLNKSVHIIPLQLIIYLVCRWCIPVLFSHSCQLHAACVLTEAPESLTIPRCFQYPFQKRKLYTASTELQKLLSITFNTCPVLSLCTHVLLFLSINVDSAAKLSTRLNILWKIVRLYVIALSSLSCRSCPFNVVKNIDHNSSTHG